MAHASVELKVFRLTEQTTADVTWRDADDDYLARVNWAQNELAIQLKAKGLRTIVQMMEPGSLERTEFKAKRIVDKRDLYEEIIHKD